MRAGPSADLPRVYDIALQAISHGDGRVDTESLRRFVAAYQAVVNLQLGELWAIPIMLRLALIENLRRVGVHVAAGRIDRNLADTWADEITSDRRERSQEPGSCHCRYGAVRSADDYAFHFRIGPAIAGAGARAGAAVNLDRAEACGIESNNRSDGAVGKSAAGS